MFSKVLVANRGEIAVRVIRALDELGIASVAVYSEADRDAQHVKRAGEAYLLGPGPAAESYLNVDKLMEVIEASGAEAVHPGYGFLAENAAFAKRLEEADVTFIGPPASAIEAMGSKTRARELMQKAGVPIVPGTTDPVETLEDAKKIAEDIGYPIAVKAAGGGGGKGFRVALEPDKLKDAFEGAAREGEKFFSDDTVYLERYLPDPRHVEVQVLADKHGTVVHLGERDCSIQRRHQKLIEESPAPLVDAELREKIGKIATDAAEAVGYHGAGTIEGLLQDGEYFFLEMNTRVQVEHCVTEETTGVDIVREQVLVAAGEKLSFAQEDIRLHGHAIECRINAEDASKNFAPAPGTVAHYREPSGPGVRVDSGVVSGTEITPLYDPMVAKLIVWDADRERATRRMRRALEEYEVEGVKTLIPFHKAIMASEQWAKGETCRDLIEDKDWLKALAFEAAPAAADDDVELEERTYTVEVSGKRFDVVVHGEPLAAGAAPRAPTAPPAAPRSASARAGGGGGGGGDTLASPLQGNVWKVMVEQGADVEEGALVCIIEAMKMENEIYAHKAGHDRRAGRPGGRRGEVRRHDRDHQVRRRVTDLDDALAELGDWLRIPSVSTAGGNPEALVEAAGWALRRIEAAGGSGELVQTGDHPPLVVGELRANRDGAPTILIYGHYDVQDAGDESRWTTPPFEPDIRDGRLYARGASDDKGNFLPLLLVACELADAGELAVNVRVLVEGEEETPADTAERWMAADERGADAAIVFDSGMLDADTPALTVGTRGMVWADLVVTTGERPAHSGEFGGAALNAVHVLHRLLAAVLPDPETGRPPEPLRAGLEAPSQAELDAWAQLPPGDRLLAEAGARPADARAGEELHVRTMAGTSVDVHRVAAGEPRTIVPERAEASLSVRLAGGQHSAEIAPALEALLRDALPATAPSSS